MRVTLSVALLLATTPSFAGSTAETAFENARDWTVYIKTSVDRAFVEDNQGSLTGSGMVIDAARGWVLTNAHVSSHSYSQIAIAFRGGKPLPAKRVYVDPYLDLAIIAYDPRLLQSPPPEPTLECDSLPPVGHPVGAFGHPWGFRFTGTRGIASAVTSRLGPDMLQTDAPINAGNSGGPLISLESGRVLGVNTATLSKGTSEGMSFAIPMPFACTIINLLRQGRDPSPPDALVDFAIDEDNEYTMVVASSRLPAGGIDLHVGDELISAGVSARALNSASDLVDALRGGLNDVTLRVRRNGADITLRGQWPAAARITERQALWLSGAMFASAEHVSAGFKGLPALMVHHVEPGSDAEASNIAPFDLLLTADGHEVRSLLELETLARRALAEDRKLALIFLRLAPANQMELFLHERRYLAATDLEWIGENRTIVGSASH